LATIYFTAESGIYFNLGVGRRPSNIKVASAAKKTSKEVRIQRWVSKKVIARLHGFSERTIDELMADAIIPYRRFPSGTLRFSPSQVEAALSRFDVEAAS
jgi:hypothetical protein